MSDSNEKQAVIFGPCMFCGEDIEANKIDPCRVVVENAGDRCQAWRCHAKCLKKLIFNSPILEPDIL